MGGERLPRVKDLIQLVTVEWLEHGMDVVWHDAPREKLVAVAVKVVQSLRDHLADVRAAQPAFTGGIVQELVHLFAVEALEALQFGGCELSLLLTGVGADDLAFNTKRFG